MNTFFVGAVLASLSGKDNAGLWVLRIYLLGFALFAVLMLGLVTGGGHTRDERAAEPEVKRDWNELREKQLRRLGVRWQGKANWREIREAELREFAIEDGKEKRAQ